MFQLHPLATIIKEEDQLSHRRYQRNLHLKRIKFSKLLQEANSKATHKSKSSKISTLILVKANQELRPIRITKRTL